MNKEWVAIGVGTNLGDKELELKAALAFLASELSDIRCSNIYESVADGFQTDNLFWNCVVIGKSVREPMQLLKELLAFEASRGRVRKANYSDRPIDLDILFFGERDIQTEVLQIPHPRWSKRPFVYIPLLEISQNLWEKEISNISTKEMALAQRKVYNLRESLCILP
jgi:2-amino-4-hydroxy-6-hydroxymethyldihydropteridine diphosphokinase